VGAALTRALRLTALAVLAAGVARGQGFEPPQARAAGRGTRLGLFGFGVRGGVELSPGGALIGAMALDLGNLASDRLRLRPSLELGVNGRWTYVAGLEALFRFTEDRESVIPYLGGGASVAGRDACGTDPQCPDLWITVAFGFEVRFRSTFNWLLEYRGLDVLRRHRIYVGLTTRRGG
jgi:hypothetical protein